MAVIGGHYVQKYSTNMANHFSSASAIASEGLDHIGLVHALGAHSRLESKFRGYLTDARKEGIRKAVAAAIQAGLLYFIAFSANALAYWQGSRKIADTVERNDGGSSVGEIYTVIFILVDGMTTQICLQRVKLTICRVHRPQPGRATFALVWRRSRCFRAAPKRHR
jgi:ABC-type multidrug transport system fused ATPase/permease subunit